MKLLRNAEDMVNSQDSEQQRKKFKSLNDYIADFEDDASKYLIFSNKTFSNKTFPRLVRESELKTARNENDDDSLVASSQGSCLSLEYSFATTSYQVSKSDEIDQYCALKIPCSLIGKDPTLFWSQKHIQDVTIVIKIF